MTRSLWSKLFGTRVDPGDAAHGLASPVPLGANERIYAIGDMHGCSALLDAMWDLIRADLARHPVQIASIVYLGDYVDRGPDSFGVLERLALPPADLPPAVQVMGNHEAVMLEFLDHDGAIGDTWRDFGGYETMRSYGVEPTRYPGRRWFEAASEALNARMPESHHALLEQLVLSVDRPPFFFCHAGVKPGVPVSDQDDETLLWIRDEFLRSTIDFGRIVVHGHTPVDAAQVLPNRINIDTRAYATGRLTCAALELGSVRLIATG